MLFIENNLNEYLKSNTQQKYLIKKLLKKTKDIPISKIGLYRSNIKKRSKHTSKSGHDT